MILNANPIYTARRVLISLSEVDAYCAPRRIFIFMLHEADAHLLRANMSIISRWAVLISYAREMDPYLLRSVRRVLSIYDHKTDPYYIFMVFRGLYSLHSARWMLISHSLQDR